MLQLANDVDEINSKIDNKIILFIIISLLIENFVIILCLIFFQNFIFLFMGKDTQRVIKKSKSVYSRMVCRMYGLC